MDSQEREIPISIEGCPSEIFFPSWMTDFIWEETTDSTFLSQLLQNLEDLAVFSFLIIIFLFMFQYLSNT